MKNSSTLCIVLAMCLLAGVFSKEGVVLSASSTSQKSLRRSSSSSATNIFRLEPTPIPNNTNHYDNTNFTAVSCPHFAFGVSHFACPLATASGCVGYSNGTYEYRADSNGCKLCADDNVTSFNTNEDCPFKISPWNRILRGGPVIVPNNTNHYDNTNFTAVSCPHFSFGVSHFACPLVTASGCVGYSNGTYEYRADSNGCKLCANDNVISFNADEDCPVKTINITKPFGGGVGPVIIPNNTNHYDNTNFTAVSCPHFAFGVSRFACPLATASGCVGYSNGTHEYRTDSNECKLCADTNVISFNANEDCPLKITPWNPIFGVGPVIIPNNTNHYDNTNFTAVSCPHFAFGVSRFACPLANTSGCVGYSNGTYEYRADSNGCKLCASANVISFNANEDCPLKITPWNPIFGVGPVIIPNNTNHYDNTNFTAVSCPHFAFGVSHFACPLATASGCVGYSNGTYEYRADSNGCKLCANDNVISFNADEDCPVKTINITKPFGGGVGPVIIPNNTNHYDNTNFTAVSCPHFAFGVSRFACPLANTSGCVGYSNGTHEYRTDSNGCKLCADDNVISFNADEDCPLKITPWNPIFGVGPVISVPLQPATL